MSAITFSVVDAGIAPARWAMGEYFGELARRFREGFDAGDALDEAASTFNPPNGIFVVATLDGATVGCGAIQYLDDNTGEIKRMWVSAASRGMGLGKRLLAFLEQQVSASGRSRVLLDTNESLSEAIAMYRSCGYVPTEPYSHNPYADLWFEKALVVPGA